jgi:hypothetical protein
MVGVRGRRALRLLRLLAGTGLVLYALGQTHETFRPVPGHTDGRGLFMLLLIPPVAAVGGMLMGDAVVHAVRSIRRQAVYFLYPVFGVLGIVPTVVYMLFYSDPNVSSQLSSYYLWFLSSGVVAVPVAGAVELGRRTLGTTAPGT